MTGDPEETPIVEVVTEGQLAAPSEVAPGTFFFPYFGNVIALLTDEGILLVDTATYPSGRDVLHELRARTDLPVHTIVYTHAHIDHAPGAIHFVNDARERGHPRPRVIAQRRAVDRLHRYERMMRQLAFISSIQWAREGEPGFGVPALPRFVYPDVTYEDRLTIEIGGEPFELRAGIGETDDATWVWAPQRNLVCSGDMFLWSCPNVGNPWKVQRYTEGWAEALGAIAALHPAILCPATALRSSAKRTCRPLLWTPRAISAPLPSRSSSA